MDVLNKINEIRNLTLSIKKSEIDNNSLTDLIKKIYPCESLLSSIEDDDLKNIYLDSLLSLSSAIYNFSFNKSISQELLQSLLKVVRDSNIKKNIYEQLLEIKKSEDNSFNDVDYVKLFNEKVAKLCSDFEVALKMEGIKAINYHPSVRDGVKNVEIYSLIKRLEYQLNELLSEENVRLIKESKNNNLKVSIIQNIFNSFNNSNIIWRVRLTREFEKKFFSRLKKISIDEKVLEGKINERIYGINFDTKGLINKVDNLKKKIFGK